MENNINQIEASVSIYKDWMFEELQAMIKIEGWSEFIKKYGVGAHTMYKIKHKDLDINIETLINNYRKVFKSK